MFYPNLKAWCIAFQCRLYIINYCFLLNPEKKKLAQLCLIVFEKTTKRTL